MNRGDEDASLPMLHATVSNSEPPVVCPRRTRRTSKMQWRGTLFSFYNYLKGTKKISDTFRLVSVDGRPRVRLINVPGEQVRYLVDVFTTAVDAKWRYMVLMFSLSYCVSWLVFGTLWWLIAHIHERYKTGKNCVDNVDSWTGAFLFSVETQTTIGYGGRQVTSECPTAVVLLVLQTLVGMLINCAMLGLIFAKMSRPKNRAKSIMFSKRATVTHRNRRLCLCWQVLDIAKHRLFDCNVRAFCVREGRSHEGEIIPFETCDLQLTIDQRNIDYTLRVFPMLPLTVMHIIDEDSPLYNLGAVDVKRQGMEIVAILEGTLPTTGMITQAITSYTSENIDWGYTFLPAIERDEYSNGNNCFDVQNLARMGKDISTPRFELKSYNSKQEDTESAGYGSSSRPHSSSLSSIADDKYRTNAMDVVITIDGNDI